MKIIGVISDTHLRERSPVFDALAEKYFSEADMVIHAGDLVVEGAMDIFVEMGKELIAVRGNMDTDFSMQRYPLSRTIQIENVACGIRHGWGSPAGIRKIIANSYGENPPEMIIYGHTHSPFSGIEDGIFYFNPGSPTDSRYTTYNSVGIIAVDGNKIEGEIIKI